MRKEDFFEVLGDLDDGIVKGAREPMNKSKRPAVFKWSAMAACLCLVAAGAFAARRLPGVSGPSGPSDTSGVEAFHSSETPQPGKTGRLIINQADQVSVADMDVRLSLYNDLSPSEQDAVWNAFETAFGISYADFTAKIPDTFTLCSFYSVDAPDKDADTGYAPHDYVFRYRTENGGEATIAICPFEEPLRDLIIKSEDPEPSRISGVTVVAYGFQNNSFLAQFSNENRNYDIETSGVAQKELEDLLAGILSG